MKITYLVVIGSTVLFWSCTTHKTQEGAVASRPAAEVPQHAASAQIDSPPASSAEVNTALHRIFADTVSSTPQEHSFATGDFNGDGSPDIAVVVHPNATKLKTLNSPIANWMIQDATNAYFPPTNQRAVVMPPKPKPQSARSNELLLAVIHGYGPRGWRDPEAQQAYLVRHAGDAPIRSHPAPDHVAGAPASIRQSEIIVEGTGFLFWTGSQYAWKNSATNQ